MTDKGDTSISMSDDRDIARQRQPSLSWVWQTSQPDEGNMGLLLAACSL
jgi:hypothetical protein